MTDQKGLSSRAKQEIVDRVNKIVLLKIKALIIKILRKEDLPGFEQVVNNGNTNLLLAFAQKKVPDLSFKIHQEMESIGQKLAQPIYD